jgi:hypothetical protein
MTTTTQRSGGETVQLGADIDEIRRVADTDLPRAIAMAAEARAGGVSHPLLHHMAALQLKHDGRLEEAVAELGRGLGHGRA